MQAVEVMEQCIKERRIIIDKMKWENDFTYLLSDQVDNREIGAYFINGRSEEHTSELQSR